MPTIDALTALEILDSRGRPTVKATLRARRAARSARASVPSGASTGTAEALELRDGDPSATAGWAAARRWRTSTARSPMRCAGRRFADQAALDAALIALDGTPNKSRLGANAILAVSLAFARAVRGRARRAALSSTSPTCIGRSRCDTLPRLTINLFSGGKHAGGQVPIQDVLRRPRRAPTIDEGLATIYAVYQAAAELTQRKYGMRPLTRRRGRARAAVPERRGDARRRGRGDPRRRASSRAATWRWRSTSRRATSTTTARYHLGGETLDSAGMIDRVARWVDRYPIVSVEDGLAEDDWANWPALRAGDRRPRARARRRLPLHEPRAHPPGDRRRTPPTRCC